MSSRTTARGRAGHGRPTVIGALLLLSLFGFGLRLLALEGQSMWSDEGLSFYRSGQTVGNIVRNIIVVDGIETVDTNPPFYFLLLHFWRVLTGDTVFAMRFLSAAVATLSIPLMYALGRRAFGYRGGLMAAFLMALSPFHIWQSQILRNYALLLTINLISVYALFAFLFPETGRPQRKWFVLWLVAALIGVYTHYFGFFVFAFGLVCLLVSALYRQGILSFLPQRRWGLVVLLTLTAVVPVTFVALDRFQAGRQIDFYYVPLPDFLSQAASAFSVGMAPFLVHDWWRIAPVVLLAFLGLWWGWPGHRWSVLFLVGYQVVPLGILFALSFINPLFNGTRHLLIGLPPFLILAAGGIVGPIRTAVKGPPDLWGRLRVAAVLLLALFSLSSQASWLYEQFTSPSLVRDDVRGAAEYLNKAATPEDLIILHDTLIRFTFDYYYHGLAPVTAVPHFPVLNPEQALATLQEAGREASRVWFLTEPEPRNGFDREALSDWAASNWHTLYERRFPHMWLSVNLVAYDVEPMVTPPPETMTPSNNSWPGYLALEGFDIPTTIYSADDWWMVFYWQRTENDMPGSPELSLRLTDGGGRVWAQWDRPFQDEGHSPTDWPLNTTVRYHQRLKVPAGLPPGQYQLSLRLVDPERNQPLPLSGGSFDLHLTDILAQPAACDSAPELWPPHITAAANIGQALTLKGFQLPEETVRPGHGIPVQALWCVRQRPDKDYLLRLQLTDAMGEVVAQSLNPLTLADYPPTQWQKDELLMSLAAITIPASAEAGTYDMKLSVVDPATEEPLRVGGLLGEQSFSLGTVEIVAWPLVLDLPAIEIPLRADFGEPLMAELHGYALDPAQPGENLTLTLFWRSRLSAIPASYAVFVHLENETGEIVAQGDGIPVYGFRPTTSWREGEIIIDEHVVSIPEWAAPGSYRLWVGFYEPETNLRPGVLVDGVVQPDGRLLLTEIIIAP